MVQSSSGIEPAICGACGVLLPVGASGCATCGSAATHPELRACAQPGGGYWVAVRATFTCNACRFDSPLNHFELGDGVRCTRCGLEQRYDLSHWRDIVSFAHEVGDLGGVGPEGRHPRSDLSIASLNPYRELGSTGGSWASQPHRQAAPGNPLCSGCRAPLVARGFENGTFVVACPRCSRHERYEVPPTVQRLRPLVAVLAAEHAAGGREVVLENAGGVAVLRCPGCGAPVEGIRASDGVAICRYCQTHCRISTQTHAGAGHRETPTKTWWLYFDQPSQRRSALVREAQRAQAKADKRREAQARPTNREGRSRPERGRTEGAKGTAKQAQLKALVPLIAVLLSAPVLYVLIVLKPFAKQGEAASAEKGPSEEALRRFSFDLSPSELGKLFGQPAQDRMSPRFSPTGVLKEADLSRGSNPSYSISVRGGEKFDAQAALRRLEELAPNRVKKAPHTFEVNTSKTLLRLDPRRFPQYSGAIQVTTWVQEDARARELANAFWAAALYLAYGDPRPSDEQLAMLRGPRVGELAKLDASTPIDDAKAAVGKISPDASCKTFNDLVAKQTRLLCELDVDHPWVTSVRLIWPNEEKARLTAVGFVLRVEKGSPDASAAMGRCIEESLGKGEKIVRDHASGAGELRWGLGTSSGGVVLGEYEVRFVAAEGADPKAAPGWAARFAELVGVIERCAP